jgi:hypothetical protein
MRLVLNFIALTTVFTVAGSNIYFRWANDWIACGLAVAAAFAICWTVEKLTERRAHNSMKKQYGKEWGNS